MVAIVIFSSLFKKKDIIRQNDITGRNQNIIQTCIRTLKIIYIKIRFFINKMIHYRILKILKINVIVIIFMIIMVMIRFIFNLCSS